MSTMQNTLLHHLRSLAARQASGALPDRQLLQAFLTQRSEMAFAALVQRHGPMVLSVCRRLLHNHHDAEDAFQAVFLVFVRKAASIRKRESVSSFLYGVAYHVAAKLKRTATRRAARERTQVCPPFVDPCDDLTWRELRSVLDEELAKLPEQHRAPLVLCYLEGKTQDEAARLLGWSKSTFRRRLESGRDRLGRQLTRRGVTLSAALSAPLLTDAAMQAALPPLLASNTVRAGLASVMGDATGTLVSAQAAALAEGGVGSSLAKKATVAVVVLVSLTLGLGGLLAHRAIHDPTLAEAPAAPKAAPPAQTPPQPARRASKQQAIEIKGRVFDPEGKPLPGARLLILTDADAEKADIAVRATTNKDGQFRFAVESTDFNAQGKATLAATAKGLGPDWIEIALENKKDITLQLVKDDVPIEGRVLDLEGRPVSGIRVQVVNLKRGDLDAWIKIVLAYNSAIPKDICSEILGVSASAMTGKDGRFRLTGIGRERGVELRLRGPGIEWARLWAVTRPGPARGWRSGQEGLYGATFDWVAGPCKPIIGTVRDSATGKPVMGIHVSSGNTLGAAVLTDREGRYRINGVGKRNNYSVGAWGVPYLDFWRDEVADTPGLEPLIVDFQVQRAIAVTGHLIDKNTRKPVQGWALYLALPDNPNRKNFTLIHGEYTSFNDQVGRTKPDGSFQVIALPGPGLLRVLPDDADRYHQVQVRIDPSESDGKPATCDIVLEPRRTLSGSPGKTKDLSDLKSKPVSATKAKEKP
jgi:RNA polymerase sigma factor (sigma-70 family)